MMAQLPLPLPVRTAMDAADFMIAPSNAAAVALIERWPDWPQHVALIHGPAHSGKTHLGQVWRSHSQAERITGAALSHDLAALLSLPHLLIDDADQIAGQASSEEALFHLFNHAQEGGSLLLTATQPVAQWGIMLPDLRTRLQSVLSAAITAPDDSLLAALLVKQFSDRQLRISHDVIDYLLPRIERSSAAAAAVVAALDQAALTDKRAITVPLARQVLDLGHSL